MVLDAHVADFNHDGFFDLAVWTTDGVPGAAQPARLEILARRRRRPFPRPAGLFGFRGAVADLNG